MRIAIGCSRHLAAAALLTSLILLSGCAGQAAAGQPASSSAVAAAQDNTSTDPGDRVICKAVASTGSRVKTRSCKTKSQWDAQQAMAEDAGARSRFGADS